MTELIDSDVLSLVLSVLLVGIGIYMLVKKKEPGARTREGSLGAQDRRVAFSGGIIFVSAGIALALSLLFPDNNIPTMLVAAAGLILAVLLELISRQQ